MSTVCAPPSTIASTLLNEGHLKNCFSFSYFPLSSIPFCSSSSTFFLLSPSPLFNYMTRDSTRGWCAIGETTASNKDRFSRFSYRGRKREGALFFAIFSDDFVPTQSSAIYDARGPVQARTQISSTALNLKQQKTTIGRREKDERRNNRRDKERWKDEKQNIYRRDIPQEMRQWKRAATAPNSSIHFKLQYLHYEKRVERETERERENG